MKGLKIASRAGRLAVSTVVGVGAGVAVFAGTSALLAKVGVGAVASAAVSMVGYVVTATVVTDKVEQKLIPEPDREQIMAYVDELLDSIKE